MTHRLFWEVLVVALATIIYGFIWVLARGTADRERAWDEALRREDEVRKRRGGQR